MLFVTSGTTAISSIKPEAYNLNSTSASAATNMGSTPAARYCHHPATLDTNVHYNKSAKWKNINNSYIRGVLILCKKNQKLLRDYIRTKMERSIRYYRIEQQLR